jgi:membrane protease YdiL (CAAX protease family)
LPRKRRPGKAERKPAIEPQPLADETLSSERKALWIIVTVILGEGFPVVISTIPDPSRFIGYLGFAQGAAGPWQAWLAGAVVAIAYVWSTTAIPAVREELFRPGFLKAIAVVAAVMAAVLEEVIFRKWIMDDFEVRGYGPIVQVLVSGAAFGLVHAMWGFFGGSFAAALQAMAATAVLGLALGAVYLVSDRSLAPCIVAHFVITALIEPGLVLAAVRGQLGRPLPGM